MTAVPRTPTERFSACTRPDVRVVTGKSQGFSDVPVALASALSRPFRAPTTGIALASDSAGTKPLAMDNLLLVEVFDAFGSRVAAVYAGATAGSPVTLDGRPLERYGADSFEVGPMLLGRAEGIAPDTPLRLRVTSLDNGDTGATSDVYVVPPPPLSDRERGIVVTNATYGGSCGVRAGNATGFVAWSCNGRAACDYRVDYKTIGDPAPGCTKDFRVEWQCGARAELRRGAILGEAGLGSSLALACN
jgi:hypothetical protein